VAASARAATCDQLLELRLVRRWVTLQFIRVLAWRAETVLVCVKEHVLHAARDIVVVISGATVGLQRVDVRADEVLEVEPTTQESPNQMR
jgi:hypothetical protein